MDCSNTSNAQDIQRIKINMVIAGFLLGASFSLTIAAAYKVWGKNTGL